MNDWSEARTLGDLGILTARWLEGDLAFNPGYGTEESPGPDLDIEDVIPILGRFNRAGFVTDWSQQGEPWEKGGYAQRAHVSGYCDENRAMLIEIVALSADLISVLHSPGDRCASGQIPITLNEGFAYTWERTATSREYLQDVYGPACHPDAVESLASAWQFAILDPVWGRNDLLWDRIADIIFAGWVENSHGSTPCDQVLLVSEGRFGYRSPRHVVVESGWSEPRGVA